MKRFIALAVLLLFIGFSIFAFAPRAEAEGSDSPVPYTVDIYGITLPEGVTFPDNGHVNIRATGSSWTNLHFEGKCITRTDAECAGERHEQAQFIGANFIPWTAFGLVEPFCVEWIQISMYNEHYGEGGQPPLCTTPETPEEPPVTPEPPVVTPPTPEPPVVTPPTSEPPVVEPPTVPEEPVVPPETPEVPPVITQTPSVPPSVTRFPTVAPRAGA